MTTRRQATPGSASTQPLAARRTLLLAAPAALLAGCGFQLRRAPEYPFKSIAVKGKGRIPAVIRRELKGQGTVQVLPEGTPLDEAEVVCEIFDQRRSSGIAASTTGGQIRELTLTLSVGFSLQTRGGKELIPRTEVTQSRDISYNETAALAKENEQELLYRDMAVDLAQQIVRRIGFVRNV